MDKLVLRLYVLIYRIKKKILETNNLFIITSIGLWSILVQTLIIIFPYSFKYILQRKMANKKTQQDINRTKSTKVTMPRGGEP